MLKKITISISESLYSQFKKKCNNNAQNISKAISQLMQDSLQEDALNYKIYKIVKSYDHLPCFDDVSELQNLINIKGDEIATFTNHPDYLYNTFGKEWYIDIDDNSYTITGWRFSKIKGGRIIEDLYEIPKEEDLKKIIEKSIKK